MAALAGFITTAISARATEGFSLEQMRAEGKSMLFHSISTMSGSTNDRPLSARLKQL